MDRYDRPSMGKPLRVPGKSDADGEYYNAKARTQKGYDQGYGQVTEQLTNQGFLKPARRKPPRADKTDYREWFDKIDVNHDGHLTAVELQDALRLAGYNFSLPTIAHMIRIHDRDLSGTISYEEFRQLNDFFNSMRKSYDKHDTDDDGELNYDETYAALKHAGFSFRRQTLQSVFQRFNPDNSGTLSLEEFLALNLFLRSAEATYTTFDPQDTGMVHMNIDQFIYAAANTQ